MFTFHYELVKTMHSFIDRIEINPRILGGKPIIKDTRIPVYIILEMLRDGLTFKEIIDEYPHLKEEDIKAVLDYSLYLVNHPDEQEIPLP